jgi:hypothetical protein
MNYRWHGGMAALALVLAGCQAAANVAGAALRPVFAVPLPANLTQPTHQDWSSDRISGTSLARQRKAYFQATAAQAPASARTLAAFPSVGNANWPFTVAAGDWVSTSPATSFFGSLVPSSVQNQIFCLTKAGRFYRIDKAAGTATAPAGGSNPVATGATFTRTYVTLSPSCTRAYLLDDTGKLHVIDTANMKEETGSPISIHGAAGGKGIAPVIDPVESTTTDTYDVIYCPTNDGYVTRLTIGTGATFGSFTLLAGNTGTLGTDLWAVANTATIPTSTPTIKIAAPAVAYNHHVYVGDQAGTVYDLDTIANAADAYDVSSNGNYTDAINSAPALEIWDSGSYPAPVNYAAPNDGDPAFLFVNSARNCNWVNLVDQSVTTSMDLYTDDQDKTHRYGYLWDYLYSFTSAKHNGTYKDGGNMDTSDAVTLPGSTNFRDQTNLETASDDAVAGSRRHVVSYMRWQDKPNLAAGFSISKAVLKLNANGNGSSPIVSAMDTSPYLNGTTTPWTFTSLVNAAGANQRPTIGANATGRFASGSKAGIVTYKDNKKYQWNITNFYGSFLTTGTGATYDFAAGMDQSTAGSLYQGGIAPGAGQYKAQKFDNLSGGKPQLQLTYVKYVHDPKDISLQTPPVIDSINHTIYVLNGNYVYGIDFNYNDPSTFEDSIYDPQVNPGGTKYTKFCRTTKGDPNNANCGGTYNAQNSFILNMSAPQLNFDGTAIYAVNMHPNNASVPPTTWDVGMSKVSLPIPATGVAPDPLDLTAGQPLVTNLSAQTVSWISNSGMQLPYMSSAYMTIDPYVNLTTGGGIYYGLVNGKLYFYQP